MLIHSQIVEFPGADTSVLAYLAHPKTESPFPAIVLLQEWWGIDTHIQQLTERFARAGFAVVTPDLYRGQATSDPTQARELATQLDRARTLQDVQGAVDFLRQHPLVQPNRVGIIGFGMGGDLAAQMAVSGQHIGAVTVFYGGYSDPTDSGTEESIRAVHVPWLGIYGALDRNIPPDYVHWLEGRLRAHGKEHQIILYPNAGHAFFNDTREDYQEAAATDAWQHTIQWFGHHLIMGRELTGGPQPR